jgi:hypothetical protein
MSDLHVLYFGVRNYSPSCLSRATSSFHLLRLHLCGIRFMKQTTVLFSVPEVERDGDAKEEDEEAF